MTTTEREMSRPFVTCGVLGEPSPQLIAELMYRAANRVQSLGDVEICDVSMTLAERPGDESCVTVYYQRGLGLPSI